MRLRLEFPKIQHYSEVSKSQGLRVFLDDTEITGVVDFDLHANGPSGLWAVDLKLLVAFDEASQREEAK